MLALVEGRRSAYDVALGIIRQVILTCWGHSLVRCEMAFVGVRRGDQTLDNAHGGGNCGRADVGQPKRWGIVQAPCTTHLTCSGVGSILALLQASRACIFCCACAPDVVAQQPSCTFTPRGASRARGWTGEVLGALCRRTPQNYYGSVDILHTALAMLHVSLATRAIQSRPMRSSWTFAPKRASQAQGVHGPQADGGSRRRWIRCCTPWANRFSHTWSLEFKAGSKEGFVPRRSNERDECRHGRERLRAILDVFKVLLSDNASGASLLDSKSAAVLASVFRNSGS